MKKTYNKLVRDGVPNIIKKSGRVFSIVQGHDDNDLLDYIKNKIIEESKEVRHANSKEEVVEELADLFEILEKLMVHMNISKKEIETKQSRKRIERGSFDNDVVLDWIIEEDH